MTANELQNIVRRLANNCWTRYWLMWQTNLGQPAKMAISCIDESGKPEPVNGIEERGFKRVDRRGYIFYVIDRTNDDGTPYISNL